MTAEEIKIKLGLDSRELDEGTRKAIGQISELGKHSEKTFLHAGSAGKAFHKVLHELSEEAPLVGLALRTAFNPMVGILAAITMGVVAVKDQLKELGEYATRVGNFTSQASANRRAAEKAAAKENLKDKLRGENEELELDDALEREIKGASPAQRQKILERITLEKLRTRRAIQQYNDKSDQRDAIRIAKEMTLQGLATEEKNIKENEETSEKYRNDYETNTKHTQFGKYSDSELIMARAKAAFKQIITLKTTLTNSGLYEDAQAALSGAKSRKEEKERQIEGFDKTLDDENKAHEEMVKKYKKLDTTIDKLKESIERSAEIETKRSQLVKRQTELQNAPYMPGISEMAQYGGPYGWLAREHMAAQHYGKMAMSYATPDEFSAMNQEVMKAQGQFRSEWASAGTGPAKQQAIRRYDERIQSLLTGRINNQEHPLEIIAQEIKSLNTKAANEGLAVRGAE